MEASTAHPTGPTALPGGNSTLAADLGLATLADEPPNLTAHDRAALTAWFERHTTDALPTSASQNISSRVLKNAACDGRLTQPSTFEFNLAIAAGIVAERAVTADLQAGQTGEPSDRAVQTARYLKHQHGALGDFLRSMPDGDKPDLIERVGEVVVRSRETLPGIDRIAYRIESQAKVSYGRRGDRLQAFGMRDLVLSARRDTDSPCRTVDIEIKTGRVRPEFNLDQARLYALLAHLGPLTQSAPQRVATVNLETGVWIVEEVTSDLLVTVARQVVDVARRIHLLQHAAHEVEPHWCGLDWCTPCSTRNDDPKEVSA